MRNVLEQAADTSGTQPPDGGIFLPKWVLAEKSSGFTDATENIQRINKMAATLTKRTMRRSPALFAVNNEVELLSEAITLHEAVAEFGDFAKTSLGEGVWLIDTPTILTNTMSRTALTKDYQEEGPQLLVISGEHITAASALAYPRSTTDYHPVLDVRIQTSADKAVGYFDGPGDVLDRPSLGSWFRFPLADLKLAVVNRGH